MFIPCPHKKKKNYKRYSKAISHVKWNMQCIQISTCLTVGLSLGCSSVVVQPLSRVWLFAIPWMAAHTPGSSVLYCLLKFAQICVHWVSDAIQPFHPLLTPSPFSFNISQHPSSSKSVLPIRWPKYWSFSFSISPSNEYSGFISFRIDWLDLLAIQEILKSLLQHQSLKASIRWISAFLMVQFSHLYMTTGKP